MAQFSLVWDNTDVLANANAISQRASYRKKVLAGAYITTGFTPANDMAKSVAAALTPTGLDDNYVYQLKVDTICTAGGPTQNDNGIREIISFVCIAPTVTKTHNSTTITINLTSTDITKMKLTLKRGSDNVIIAGPVILPKVSNAVSMVVNDLVPETNYYWQTEEYANVNNVEVSSGQAGFLNTPCGPYAFATDASPICNPITSMTVVSVEL